MNKFITFFLLLFCATRAFSYDYDIGKDSNTRNGTLSQGKVMTGKVIQIRNVQIQPTRTATNTGRAIGAAVGAGLGRAANNNSYYLAGVGGLLGGVVGDYGADKLTSSRAQEIIVLLPNDTAVTYTQAQSDLIPGMEVLIVQSAGKWRVIPKTASIPQQKRP